MKFAALVLLAWGVVFGAHASAEEVMIQRMPLGSGTPGKTGYENAVPVGNGLYHAPQYPPGHPTAATIWPRVVEVPCKKEGDKLLCEGYQWLPAMGRGEYLYFKPVVAQPVAAPVPPAPPANRPLPVYPRSRG